MKHRSALLLLALLAAACSDEPTEPTSDLADIPADLADAADVPSADLPDAADVLADLADAGVDPTDLSVDAAPDLTGDAVPDLAVDPDLVSDPDASAPAWRTCPVDESATTESLAEKAAYYDDIATRLHLHPQLRFIASVDLPTTTAPCADDPESTCTVPAVDPDEATWEDVARFHTSPNDGLWSALYMTSQAYRYAVTGDAEALDTLRLLMEGERQRMEITGVPGVFTRRYIPPGLDGVQCPTDDSAYVADVEKDDDRWVRIDDDGCVTYVDPETSEWTTSDHCGLEDYAGWCWYDNVSQDEYVGHLYALGAILELVDDEDLRAAARDLLSQLGHHLMDNDLQFVDWDGRVTEHGAIFTPELAVSFVGTAAYGTGDAELIEWYETCLEQRDGPNRCISWLPNFVFPMSEHFALLSPYLGRDGCESNWNTFSMALASYQNIIWFPADRATARRARAAFDETLFRADNVRALLHEENPWYTFVWASAMPMRPWSEDAQSAIEDALCAMERFPARREQQGVDLGDSVEPVCISRLDDPMAADPLPPDMRCPRHFLWWFPPYEIDTCAAAPWIVHHPADYLLAYWLGRYHGYISADD